MKKRAPLFVLIPALLCFMASCAAAEPAGSMEPTMAAESVPSVSSTPAPTATPKTTEQILAETEEKTAQSIQESFQFDTEELLPQGEDAARFDINLSNNTKSQWVLDIRDEVSGAITEAVENAEAAYGGQGIQFINQITAPGWQYLYMLLRMTQGDAAEFERYIASTLLVEVSATYDNDTMVCTVTVAPVNPRDAIASIAGDDSEVRLQAELVYAYMNTVFDENLSELEYVLPEAEGNLAEGITWPLERYTRLRKTWYAARDGGNRKHTGTDIWAPEGTEIYSCTSGEIIFVRFTEKGGNTVAVLDDYGYIFEYNHMLSLSDFLQEGQRAEAGQRIGFVGNTGNSSRDHLHLTIISPDGKLIDPYSYLKAVIPD